jgi:flagellar hook-length control protein FliK
MEDHSALAEWEVACDRHDDAMIDVTEADAAEASAHEASELAEAAYERATDACALAARKGRGHYLGPLQAATAAAEAAAKKLKQAQERVEHSDAAELRASDAVAAAAGVPPAAPAGAGAPAAAVALTPPPPRRAAARGRGSGAAAEEAREQAGITRAAPATR